MPIVTKEDFSQAIRVVRAGVQDATSQGAGMMTTISTLQSLVAQLEDQMAAQTSAQANAPMDPDLCVQMQALLTDVARLNSIFNPPATAPTVTAPGTPVPLPSIPVLTQTVTP